MIIKVICFASNPIRLETNCILIYDKGLGNISLERDVARNACSSDTGS